MTKKYIDELNNNYQKKALEALEALKYKDTVPIISFEDEQAFKNFLIYDLKIENYEYMYEILASNSLQCIRFFIQL